MKTAPHGTEPGGTEPGVTAAAHAVGRGFVAVFRAMKLIRPSRPIHPRGLRLSGSLEIVGTAPGSGIPWLDTPRRAPVQARLSRSVGLPGPLPDIVGLAVKIASGEGPADVLFASTGRSPVGRFVLLPRRNAAGTLLSTMMPYQGATGPVLLAARTTGPSGRLPASLPAFRRTLAGRPWTLELCHARPLGPWIPFGTLTLTLDAGQDQGDLRFDPVLHPLPTAQTYRWAAELRRGSYAVARAPRPLEP